MAKKKIKHEKVKRIKLKVKARKTKAKPMKHRIHKKKHSRRPSNKGKDSKVRKIKAYLRSLQNPKKKKK